MRYYFNKISLDPDGLGAVPHWRCCPESSSKQCLARTCRMDSLTWMISLADGGITMICVTHEMGFARAVAHRVIFMDRGEILESADPEAFFKKPQHERTRTFLSQILNH